VSLTPPASGAAALEPMRALRPRLMGQGVGNVALNAGALVLNLASTLLLTRVLGSRGFGAYSFALAWGMLLAVPAVLGLTPLIIREIAAYRVSESWSAIRGLLVRTNQLVVISSGVICLVALAACLLLSWPEERLFRPALTALLLVPLVAITSVRQGGMQGFGRVVVGRAPEAVVSPALLVAVAGGMALVMGDKFSATWAMAANVIAVALAAVLGVELLRRTLPSGVRRTRAEYQTRRWARAATPLIVFSLLATVNTYVPTVLLGALSGPRAAGIFSLATKISNLLPFLLIAAMPAAMPVIAELHTRGDYAAVQRIMSRTAQLIAVGSLPIAVVALAIPGPILDIFGSDFGGGSTPLRILAAGQIVNVVSGLPGTILMMVNDAGTVTAAVAVSTAVNLALAAALIPGHGAIGAAIATSVSVVVLNVLLVVALLRRHRIYAPAFSPPRRGS
jgi:O-antigen/teichoic acid export membrane protein